MTQRHGIYSVPLPISGKKLAASVVTLAAIWRSGRDSNPRAIARKLISSQPRYDHFDTAAWCFNSIPEKSPFVKGQRADAARCGRVRRPPG